MTAYLLFPVATPARGDCQPNRFDRTHQETNP